MSCPEGKGWTTRPDLPPQRSNTQLIKQRLAYNRATSPDLPPQSSTTQLIKQGLAYNNVV